jgi:hypothetical protein
MNHLPLVLAYLGPETMLPMTSVVAGIAGVIMMFGRTSLRWVVARFRQVLPSSKPKVPDRRIGTGPVGSTKSKVRV